MKKIFNKTRTAFIATLAASGMATAVLAGCAGTGSDTTAKATENIHTASNDSYKGKTVTGKVVSIEENDITIETDSDEGSSSGETLMFELGNDTKYLKESGPGSGGNAPQGQPPEKPGGDSDSGNVPGSSADSGNGSSNSGSESAGSDGNAPQGQPPEKPEGDSSDNGQPPEKPDGNTSDNGQPPEKPEGDSSGNGQPGGESSEISKDDIKTGDNISIVIDENGKVTSVTVKDNNSGQGMPGGGSSNVEYVSVRTVESDETISGETIDSTGDDENALLVKNGANASFTNGTLTRTSSSSAGGDNASFYGVGAAALVTDGELHVESSTISTDADGGAGVFAYGVGTAYVKNSKITTKQGASGGIHVAGGGTLYAENLEVETNGRSSAAIRSDRGGGTMVVDGGTYTSNGNGSPAIYSTADITVSNATLTATGSEAICIEGKNSIKLTNCDLSGNMSDDEQNDHTWNVILYQSMSGDSEVGNSTFSMDGGSLTAKNGGMFYSTNTESTFVLKSVDITYADDSEYFLRVSGNNNKRGWGSSGSNGADTSFTAISQEMQGKVIWDSISVLDMYMTDGSTLTGSVEKDDSYAGGGTGGKCSFYISEDSTWVVTGDSTLTNLYNAGSIKDSNGKTVTVKDTSGKVLVNGDSQYTITVDNYSETADLSGAEKI